MKLFNTIPDRNNFLKLILKIILVLVVIQVLRAVIFEFLFVTIQPTGPLFMIFRGLDFIIVGIILLFYFKPSLDDLGLKWDNIRLRSRIIYIMGFSLLTILILSQSVFEGEFDILIGLLVYAIISPIFEELVFRGYIWSKISESEGMINPDGLTFLTVTLLFSVWQLGYADVLIRYSNLGLIMVLKMMGGLVLGLFVGYLRLKTGKTYASIIFHGLWSLFEP
ncbi:MAG: CPBP family intramembrane glutamic endopeptidase [Methanothermobacter sp.]